MIKVAALTLDIYDDEKAEIARSLPAELHSVKVAEREEVDALPDRQFGLVMKTAGDAMRRRFPLHTADAVKISRAYFERTKVCLPTEAATVAEAKIAAAERALAAEGEIDTRTKDMLAKVAYVDVTALKPQMAKVAFAEQHWGLTINGKNCFPLHDASLVKTALSRFPSTVGDLEPEERFIYARNIAKRAEALSVEVDAKHQVNLYTNDTVNRTALKVAIAARKQAVGTKVSTLVLDQLHEAAGCDLEQGMVERDASFELRKSKHAAFLKTSGAIDAERIVGVLQAFDKMAGLGQHHYVRGLADPFASCFKKADCSSSATMVDGVDLSSIAPNMLQDKFDEGFVNDFAQNPVQVYQSLPDPVKAVIRQLADDAMNGVAKDIGAPADAAVPGAVGDPGQRLAPALSNAPSAIVY